MKPEYVRGAVARILESALPLHLPIEFDPEREAGTGYTTENRIVIGTRNGEEKLPQVVAVLAHEMLHVLCEHYRRAKDVVPEKDAGKWLLWNLAADDVANRMLKDLLDAKTRIVSVAAAAKNFIATTGVDLSSVSGYPENAPTEVIYRWLLEQERNSRITWRLVVSSDGNNERDQSAEEGVTVEVTITDRDGNEQTFRVTLGKRFKVTDDTSMAAERFAVQQAFKEQGLDPFGANRDWQAAGTPLSLEKHLRNYFKTFAGSRGNLLSFLLPNKRIMALSYPIMFPERVKKVVNALVAIDTSGSISQEEIDKFYGILTANLHLMNFDLVFCDADLYGPYRLSGTSPEQVKLKLKNIKPKGGGGTSYEPVFEFFRKEGKYDLLIYFTDLFCDFPKQHPPRILWVVQQNHHTYSRRPPYGKVIWF